jgi:SAM-dependent methyltransferase
MKARESGMPEEAYWQTFFDAAAALDQLIPQRDTAAEIVEFGCGYGTFTLPAARRTSGQLTALDIEPEMVATVAAKAAAAGVGNVHAIQRDFVLEGTGLAAGTQTYALVFNLLHLEEPEALLREAHRVLRPTGQIAVMHWRNDIPTPRGPSLAIRPTAEQCSAWLLDAGFTGVQLVDLAGSCPYHYGLTAWR